MEITPDDIANDRVMDLQGAIAEFRAEFPEDNNVLFADNTCAATLEDALAKTYGMLGEAVINKIKQKGYLTPLRRNFENGWPVAHSYSYSDCKGFTVITVSTALAAENGKPRFQPLYPSLPHTRIETDEDFARKLPDMPEQLRNHEIWQRFCFDHEASHGLTFNRHGYGLRREVAVEESICDAYALVRHYQREGTDDGFGEYLLQLRTLRALEQNDFSHWTCKAIEKIIELKDDGFDFSALSPKKSYALAHDMVLDPVNEIRADCHKLRAAFQHSVRQKLGEPAEAFLGWLAETGANSEHAVVRDFAENWFDMRAAIKPWSMDGTNDAAFLEALENSKAAMSQPANDDDVQEITAHAARRRAITPVILPSR